MQGDAADNVGSANGSFTVRAPTVDAPAQRVFECLRLDDQIELYPIDMGYDHFTVNNLSYHGTNVTIVWPASSKRLSLRARPLGLRNSASSSSLPSAHLAITARTSGDG